MNARIAMCCCQFWSAIQENVFRLMKTDSKSLMAKGNYKGNMSQFEVKRLDHYNDIIMGTMASQIANLTIVYSNICSDANQRKHQSSASLAFVWGIHRWPVNSSHKWPVTQKMLPFDDVIMWRSVGTVPPKCWLQRCSPKGLPTVGKFIHKQAPTQIPCSAL